MINKGKPVTRSNSYPATHTKIRVIYRLQREVDGPRKRDGEREDPDDHDDAAAGAGGDLAAHGVADGQRAVHGDGHQGVDGR